METLADRLARLGERIAAACRSAGRDPATVTLVAVTKAFPVETVRAAYDVGLRTFGESRLQEAVPKVRALPVDVSWHFIGRLQTNKAKRAAELFDAVHTLEAEGQLREIAKAGRTLDGLIEVNVGAEPQKSGILPQKLDVFVEQVLQCECVRFRGLMTVPPYDPDPETARPVFRELARLGDRVGAQWLSMGMSGDMEVAIQEGASHIRIGSALFGERRVSTDGQ